MNLLPLSDILVAANRQRQAITPADIGELADSIERVGLLQPIVVERRYNFKSSLHEVHLRAGERRIRAVTLLHSQNTPIRHGHETLPLGTIPIVNFPDLDELTAFDIELDENIKRRDLTWQEKDAAYARRHAIAVKHNPNPTEAIRETLAAIQRVSPSEIKTGLTDAHQAILVGNALSDPEVAKAKSHKEAVKILTRKLRKAEDAATPPADDPHFILGEAITVIDTLPDAYFDCIVSDPIYGMGISQLSYQNSSEQEYDDTYETWAPLVRNLFSGLQRVLKPDAHGYLFCAFERFTELAAVARDAGFEVFPRPLIWDRSPDGRLTTPEKWPRRCYECILYFRRGNRDLYEVRGDVLRYPADRDERNYHGAKKPWSLVADLMERSTRPGGRVLDPFAGSAAVARAGRLLSREVWSIEMDPGYFALGQKLLQEMKDESF